jgi:hypothetical protein
MKSWLKPCAIWQQSDTITLEILWKSLSRAVASDDLFNDAVRHGYIHALHFTSIFGEAVVKTGRDHQRARRAC